MISLRKYHRASCAYACARRAIAPSPREPRRVLSRRHASPVCCQPSRGTTRPAGFPWRSSRDTRPSWESLPHTTPLCALQWCRRRSYGLAGREGSGARAATEAEGKRRRSVSKRQAALWAVSVSAIAQEPFIVGTWSLTGADKLLPGGQRVPDYGPNPHGLVIFTADGYYSVQIYRAERLKFSSGSKFKGTPEDRPVFRPESG